MNHYQELKKCSLNSKSLFDGEKLSKKWQSIGELVCHQHCDQWCMLQVTPKTTGNNMLINLVLCPVFQLCNSIGWGIYFLVNQALQDATTSKGCKGNKTRKKLKG